MCLMLEMLFRDKVLFFTCTYLGVNSGVCGMVWGCIHRRSHVWCNAVQLLGGCACAGLHDPRAKDARPTHLCALAHML